MANIFSPQEILRIAVKVEEQGKKLYQILEEKAGSEQLKNLWHYLGEQEEVHRGIFQGMLERVGDYIIDEFSPGEYQAYLEALASEYVFTPGIIEQKMREVFASDIQAVEFGIYIEKESILIYSALSEYVHTDKQSVLKKVIDEEKRHVAQLISLKKQLK